MSETQEADLARWWAEEGWTLGVLPITNIRAVRSVRADGTRIERYQHDRDERFKVWSDRVLWWRWDAAMDELCVRIPGSADTQALDAGLWIEKRYRLTGDGRIVSSGYGQLMDFAHSDPFSAAALRSVQLRGVGLQIDRHMRVMVRRLGLGSEWEQAAVSVTRPGSRGMPDVEVAQWAERFVDALQVDPRRPYVVLRERYPGWSDSGLRGVIHRARDKKLLEEVGRGQTGGGLTDRARELLGR